MTIPANLIRDKAQGRWEGIFCQLAGDALGPAMLAAKRKGGDTHVPCPIHGGKDGLRFFPDWEETGGAICNTCGSFHNGIDLIMALNRWSFPETVEAIARALGIAQGTSKASNWKCPIAAPTQTKERDLSKVREARARIRFLWEHAEAYTPENLENVLPLRRYLVNRGIDLTQIPDVRFMAKALTMSVPIAMTRTMMKDDAGLDGETRQSPAMFAAVRDLDGRLVTVHRTFITKEGRKANLEQPKRLMRLADGDTITGCAIRFGNPKNVLCLAEGIETALSVVAATGLPCWSTSSANGMKTVRIPESVRSVFIFADRDASEVGMQAAKALAARLEAEGRAVRILLPEPRVPTDAKGIDWNDVIRVEGVKAFPLISSKKMLGGH